MIKNYLKRYLAVSVLAIAGIATALACGPWERPHYYVFSAYQRNQLGNTFTDRMEKFWYDYAPALKESPWAVGYLSSVDQQDFENSDNVIIKTAFAKDDKEMIDYLRLLTKYLKISDDVRGDSWSYPTKDELAQRNKDLKYIQFRARSYSGTRLAGQYCLLAMRTHMLMGDHAYNLAYWSNHKDKLAPSVYKDMMKGIYAGALVNTGNLNEAAEIYYELGDMLSLMWVMRDQRNLDGIKKEYARNPNSPALIFLVQDFVNNTSDSHYSCQNHRWCYRGDDEDDAEIVKQMAAFVQFAQQVMNEGETRTPALWQAAMGWLNHSMGNSSLAISQLEAAMKMKGTERMLDNARVCRLVATAESTKDEKKLCAFMEKELKWMIEKETAEPSDAGCIYCDKGSNHYTEVMQNLIYDSLAPRLYEEGNYNLATSLLGWMNNHTVDNGDFKRAVDFLSAQEMIEYYKYLNSKPATSFESWLNADVKIDADLYNDMVGTKMIREGRFSEAIPYLEKVSLAFLATQAIAPYAAARDYHKEQCFVRQYETVNDYPVAIKTNQKLDFCKDMLKVKGVFDKATEPVEKAEAAYRMANYYFQASYRGNCWYLSRYGNSVMDTVCYKNEKDFLAEAANLYAEALAQPGLSAAHTQCFLYAAAYLPFGEPYQTYEYDEDYNGHWVYNKESHQYKALYALKLYTKQTSSPLKPYITRCDVLNRFL